MATKMAKISKKVKTVADNIRHPPYLRITIPAQNARPAPPLGPSLGNKNINIAAFCKDFNEKTQHLLPDVPTPCTIKVNPDRSYILDIDTPPAWYLLRLAAGAKKGASDPIREISGYITVKHIYEIAQIKQQDKINKSKSLKQICEFLVRLCHSIGLKIVKKNEFIDENGNTQTFDESFYGNFLRERDSFLDDRKQFLLEKKSSKLMRG